MPDCLPVPHVPTSDAVCSSDITSTNADAAFGVDAFDVGGVDVWSEIEYRTGSWRVHKFSEHIYRAIFSIDDNVLWNLWFVLRMRSAVWRVRSVDARSLKFVHSL